MSDRSPGNALLSSARFFTHFVLSVFEKIVVIAGFERIDNTYLVCVCVCMCVYDHTLASSHQIEPF